MVIRTEQARRNLGWFIRDGWHVLEPSTRLEWSWHHEAICLHLQAVVEDWIRHQQNPEYVQRIQNLLINVPPGTMKSRIVSVYLLPWIWLKWPAFKAIFLSSNPRVALRDSVLCRDVLTSDWYRQRFNPTWSFAADQDAKSLYKNTQGGYRSAMGFSSRITGERADGLFVDDPHDAEEVRSDTIRQDVLDRWDSAIANRVNDLRSSVRIGIMQRLHEDDWAGHVLRQGGWHHLCLPMEYEAPSCKCPECQAGETVLGWTDPRTDDGDVLQPTRFTAVVLTAEKRRLGSYGTAGQLQQRPSPADGGMIKRGWWQTYSLEPEVMAASCDELIQSWDATFKDTKTSDYVVGQLWGRKGANAYLIDQIRARMDFPTTVSAVKRMSAKWPDAHTRLIEDKANGPAIIASLRNEISGLIPINPRGSKEARVAAVSPAIEAGNVYLPDPQHAPWVSDFIEECAAFPVGAHDDQVDAMSQALQRMEEQHRAMPAMDLDFGTGVSRWNMG